MFQHKYDHMWDRGVDHQLGRRDGGQLAAQVSGIAGRPLFIGPCVRVPALSSRHWAHEDCRPNWPSSEARRRHRSHKYRRRSPTRTCAILFRFQERSLSGALSREALSRGADAAVLHHNADVGFGALLNTKSCSASFVLTGALGRAGEIRSIGRLIRNEPSKQIEGGYS